MIVGVVDPEAWGDAGMKRDLSPRFEPLEERQLLSRAHVHPAVARPARPPANPIVLNGTLTVDENASQMASGENPDGSTSTSTAVAGQLAGLGEIHGIWDETVDQFGDYEGPDTLTLKNTKGTFVVAFNNDNASAPNVKGHRPVSYEHKQIVEGGDGAYARATETGTIELTTNAARTQVASITLHTQGT